MNPQATISITQPAWIDTVIDRQKIYAGDGEKMALAIELARQNTKHGTGGPFGAAIFNRDTGQLLSVGVNCVVASNNSVLHAEVMAIMFAEQQLQSFSLGHAPLELFSSCEPCAMCLGASLWSGVQRLVCAATGEDARAIGFDEGPVFELSYRYLEEKGITVNRGVSRAEAKTVLDNYARSGGLIYNAGS